MCKKIFEKIVIFQIRKKNEGHFFQLFLAFNKNFKKYIL